MTALIGLDWGTTSLRAYRLDASGAVQEVRSGPHGVLQVPAGGFEAILTEWIGDWLKPDLPILASGMVGSRQGWVEVPYQRLPCGPEELAAHLLPVPLQSGGMVQIVPGVCDEDARGHRDVMRGEETQVIGTAVSSGLLILPGSHSKWVQVQNGRLERHRTFLTGELFAALHQHTLLGRLMTSTDPHPEAFARGVEEAQQEAGASGGLLHQLFGVRTLGLFEQLPAEGLYDYLSGLLIGTEIRDAHTAFPDAAQAPVLVVGTDALSERYRHALTLAGVANEAGPPEAAARGLFHLARLQAGASSLP